MKYLLVGLALVGLVGCGKGTESDSGKNSARVDCFNGVEYYVTGYKMAVKYNTDGTVSLCNTQTNGE